jgi:hypothetical protein
MMHLVQLGRREERVVGRVHGDRLLCMAGVESVYDLAMRSLRDGASFQKAIANAPISNNLDYESIYRGESDWHLLPPADIPDSPWRCLVSGTGLTHLGSARDRQAMHTTAQNAMTDSMKMFQAGLEGGRPADDTPGVAPEWFYKGNGHILRAHLEPLVVPSYAEDGGEEAEIAAIYIIADDGLPRRLGFAMGNEFSDHVFEKKNYLNLAGSKLRNCSIGPELAVDVDFRHLSGRVSIERAGADLWSAAIESGEEAMSHSLRNLEHHLFKFENHRVAGDLHVHFLGAATLSFGSGIHLEAGDVMQVAFEGMGRPLRNPLQIDTPVNRLIAAEPLA